jgi:hypothetical protein
MWQKVHWCGIDRRKSDAERGGLLARGVLRKNAGAYGMIAHNAGSAYNQCMQYTIRGVSSAVDAALRRRARALGKSLNAVAVEALADGAGVRTSPPERRDLSDVAGTWTRERAVEAALAAQDAIDEALWR